MAGRDRGAGRHKAAGPSPRHRQRGGVEFGQRRRSREVVGDRGVRDHRCQRLAVLAGQPGGQGSRPGHRNLLTQHGAHQQLSPVRRARDADTGPVADSIGEKLIRAQDGIDLTRIGIEVEEPARYLLGRIEVAAIAKNDLGRQPTTLIIARCSRPNRGGVHAENGVTVGEPQRPAIGVPVPGLDSGHGAPAKKGEDGPCIQRWAELQTQLDRSPRGLVPTTWCQNDTDTLIAPSSREWASSNARLTSSMGRMCDSRGPTSISPRAIMSKATRKDTRPGSN